MGNIKNMLANSFRRMIAPSIGARTFATASIN